MTASDRAVYDTDMQDGASYSGDTTAGAELLGARGHTELHEEGDVPSPRRELNVTDPYHVNFKSMSSAAKKTKVGVLYFDSQSTHLLYRLLWSFIVGF